MKNKSILITGISGFLGYHLYNELYENNNIVGIYLSNCPNLPKAKLYSCDITDINKIESTLKEKTFDVVFHLAAFSKTGLCEQNPNKSYKINVLGTNNIFQYCFKNKIPLIFTSTDLVFDGVKGDYSEEDIANPINVYGKHKLLAEQSLKSKESNTWIVRMPLLLGNVGTAGKSFIQDFLKSYNTGKSMPLFEDEIRDPITGPYAAKSLVWLSSQEKGTYHLGGKSYSRYEMGLRFSKIFSLDSSKIIRSRHNQVTLLCPRPKNLSLNCNKAIEKGLIQRDCMDDLLSLLPLF
jgi:dTDP-4-dehydrorhamnose reductase